MCGAGGGGAPSILEGEFDLFVADKQGKSLDPGQGHNAESRNGSSPVRRPADPSWQEPEPEDRSSALAGKHMAIDK